MSNTPGRMLPTFLACISLTLPAFAAPTVSSTVPVPATGVGSLTSISVAFNEAVSGVEAADLMVNGEPAVSLTGSGAGPYVFGFTQPPPGTVSVEWTDDHGISGLGTGAFSPGGAWAYTLADNLAPTIDLLETSVPGQSSKHVLPGPSAVVSTLTQATVYFSEPVTGVESADLRINGLGAGAVTGAESGPYIFTFTQPGNGAVNFTWQAAPGIMDGSGNLFVPENWSVTKSSSIGSVVISEFLAANGGAVSNTVNGTRDEDFDLSPWIELYNPGGSTVDLSGWCLTNDADEPAMWILPQRTLAAGARLVVWASGKDRKPASGHLHTNFTLDVDGGYLALYPPNQPNAGPASVYPSNYPTIQDYPSQRFDYSYGMRSGDNALRYFSPPSVDQSAYTLPTSNSPNPTPPSVPVGAANGTSNLNSVTPNPTSSVNHGFYTSPFSVILSCEQPGAAIRYTTNGSVPLSTDTAYSSPIAINGTTVLRFAAFGTDSVPSETMTRTYLFAETVTQQMSPPYTGGSNPPIVGNQSLPLNWGSQSGFGFPGLITNLSNNQIPADYGMDPKIHADPNRYDDAGNLNPAGKTNLERIHAGLRSLPVLSVVMKNDDMFGPGGLYPTSSSGNKADNTKACSLEMFDASGNTVFESTAGIDNHGNASRDPYKNPKHGYTLRFKGRYGNGRLKGKIYPDSPVGEWDKLVLRADFGFSWLHWDGGLQRPRGIRIRDPFCKDSFRDMGCIAGHNRFVNLFINGVYWGTFDIAEDEDEDFSASYFGGDKNQHDIIEQNVLKSGSWTVYREIKRILGWTGAPNYNTGPSSGKLASAFTNAEYEEIKQHLDVPWHCDYMILHYYIGHEDWGTQTAYDKNWYAARPPGGKYRYLPWDMENVMNSPTNNRVTGATYPPTAIQSRLKKNDQYLLDFADRTNRHMINPDGALLPASSIARLDRWTSIMNADAMCLESARWGDYRDRVHVYNSDSNVIYSWNGSWYENGVRSTSGTHWLAEINRMRDVYFPVRTNNVLGQFRDAGLYPLLNAPEFLNASNNVATGSKQVSVGYQLKMQLPASPPPGTTNSGSIYYTTDGSDPRVYYDLSGIPAPGAVLYTGPITLNSTVTVKTRTLNGTTWSALRENTFTVGSRQPRVVISEIHYRPSSGGTTREFVEIHNAGGNIEDLSLWTMEGIEFIFPMGTQVAPGQRLVLANNGNPSGFAAAYPAVVVFGYFSGSLDNGGERLTLFNRNGDVVSSVHYRDLSPWPTTPDGGGPSLEMIQSLNDIESAVNWQPSASNHGTPGLPNAAAPAATLILSEFSAGDSGFVEIVNNSVSAASTSGWSLRVLVSGNTYTPIAIPDLSLSAGELLVVNTPLDSQQGHIILVDAAGKARDGIRYGPQAAGFSFSRISNLWRLTDATSGTANALAAVAAVSNLRINEFLADPVPGQDDWLEIANLAPQPVDLTGLVITSGVDQQFITSPTAIAPDSHLRLFCGSSSGRGDTLATTIPASGGILSLGEAGGTVIDSHVYASQSVDVSSGRLPDRSGALTVLPFNSPAAPNHDVLTDVPVFNEVMVRNRSGELNPWAQRSAWIELKNPASSAVSLTQWSIRGIGDTTQSWPFPPGTSIPANGMLSIWADPASASSITFSSHLNSGIGIDSEFDHDYSAWGLELVNPQGQIADRITWGIQVPDQSIGRDGAGIWKLLGSPTPGEPNASPAGLGALAGVRINEWAGLDMLLGGIPTGQFSELHNASARSVELSGLWLGDEPSESGTRRWRFPALSFIGAGSHALLLPSTGGNDPARPNFSLSRGGEMLILSNESSTMDSVGFGISAATVSQGRSPDGGAVIAALLPTPGAPNVPANSPSPVFYRHPRSRSVAAGTSLTLSAAAQPATSYQWYLNGLPFQGGNSPSLVLNPTTAAHEGNWHCEASNGGAPVSSETAAITVYYNYEKLAAEKSLGPANGDDDGDGISNAIEFLTGSDPLFADRSPASTSLEMEGENLYLLQTMRISGRAAYSGLTGELSADFEAWLRNGPFQSSVLSTAPNGDRTMQFKFLMPANEPRQFLRMVLDP